MSCVLAILFLKKSLGNDIVAETPPGSDDIIISVHPRKCMKRGNSPERQKEGRPHGEYVLLFCYSVVLVSIFNFSIVRN